MTILPIGPQLMRFSVILISLAAVTCNPVTVVASTVHVSINDQNGRSVAGAVVSLAPLDGSHAVKHENTTVIDQRERAFVPQVIAVATGTEVEFPNSDVIRHHVYSFSKPKHFDLKLYSGQSMPSVLFDKSGLVSMGCNIHDWMRGYIYVLDEPYFSVSNESGDAWLNVPPGKYHLVTRHPRQKLEAEDVITVNGDQYTDFVITINIETKGDLPLQSEDSGSFNAY